VGLLAGTLVLAVMILPLIVSISLDALRMVPDSYREAALGLGATRWEMIRLAVLPAARSGLVGSCILALGRALGETMAITMVIGNANLIRWSLFQPSNSIASVIANQFGEATDLMLSALIELALILFVMTLLVNLAARTLVNKLAARKGVLV
jgi:phosphate transport system permease protein